MSAALLHRPQAVVVDEPMVGLDPRDARLIKDAFRRMSDRGVAILMSTHTLEVAQEMCHCTFGEPGGQLPDAGRCAELVNGRRRSCFGEDSAESKGPFWRLGRYN